jgi:hypothetical protein
MSDFLREAHGGDDTVFVIDSAFVAMALTLLKPAGRVHCIYELKEGVDENSPFAPTADLLLADLSLASRTEVTVPSPYFRPSGPKRFAFEQRFRRAIRAKVDVNRRFIGPKTSAIMSIVPAQQRTYVDHGTGDYNARALTWVESRFKRWLKYRIKTVLGFSNHYIPAGCSGYTMCRMMGDPFRHLDYRDLVVSAALQAEMQSLKDRVTGERPTLVLPTQPWHSKDGFTGDMVSYDQLNLAMVKQHCQRSELLLIKWHPAFFMAKNLKSGLLAMLHEAGYRAFDVDDLISARCRGHIPAEVIVKHCGVGKVVAEQSSVFYNLAHDPTVTKATSALLFDRALKRQGVVLGYYQRLNPLLCEPLLVA